MSSVLKSSSIKTLKIISIVTFAMIAIVLGLAVILSNINNNYFRGLISNQFQKMTGYELMIEGDLNFQLLPYPRFEANDVTVMLDLEAHPYRLHAKKVYFDATFSSLLGHDLHLDYVKVKQLDIEDKLNSANAYHIETIGFILETHQDKIYLKDINLEYTHGMLLGDVALNFSNKHHIDASFDIPRIEITPSEDASLKRFDIFSSLTLLSNLSAKIKLNVDEFTFSPLTFKKAELDVNLSDNKITIEQNSFLFEKPVSTSINLNDITNPDEPLQIIMSMAEIPAGLLIPNTWDLHADKDINAKISLHGHIPYQLYQTSQFDLDGKIIMVFTKHGDIIYENTAKLQLESDNLEDLAPILKINANIEHVKTGFWLSLFDKEIAIKGGQVQVDLNATMNVSDPINSFQGVLYAKGKDITSMVKTFHKQAATPNAFEEISLNQITNMEMDFQIKEHQATLIKTNIDADSIHIQGTPKQSHEFISTAPFDFTNINKLDGKVNIRAKHFKINKHQMTDAELIIQRSNNQVQINKKAGWLGGRSILDLTLLHTTSNHPAVNMKYSLSNANATDILHLFDNNTNIQNGQVSFRIEGRGRANSAKTLAATFNGHTLLEIYNVRVLDKTRGSPRSLLGALFSAFSFKENKNQDVVHCMIGRFQIHNGVAQTNRGVGIETNALLGLGSGQINFSDETLDFDFNFQPKKNLNFNPINYNHLIKVSGPILNPNIRLSELDVAKKAGSILLAITTGGLSILGQELVNLTRSGRSPCAIVLKGE